MKKQKKLFNNNLPVIAIFAFILIVIVSIVPFFKHSNKQFFLPTMGTMSDSEQNSNKNSLTNTAWVWHETSMNDGVTIIPTEEGVFTMTFDDAGQVHITTDCNNGSGLYTVQNSSKLTFKSIASTLKLCGESQEERFYQDLQHIREYSIVNDTLRLQFKDDVGKMVFTREK